MKHTPLLLRALAATLALCAACGSSSDPHGSHGSPDASTDTPAADASATDASATDASATDGSSGPPAMLNDCTPADYVDRGATDAERVIRPRGTTGYTPRCVTVRVGQQVVFEMDFSAHPLVPGIPHGPTAGATTPSPITAQRSGARAEVTFAAAGNYPFYCDRHGHVGMAGVVRVVP